MNGKFSNGCQRLSDRRVESGLKSLSNSLFGQQNIPARERDEVVITDSISTAATVAVSNM